MRPIIFIPQGIDALGFGLKRESLELIVEEFCSVYLVWQRNHQTQIISPVFGKSCEEFDSSCNFVALSRNKLETVSGKERQ